MINTFISFLITCRKEVTVETGELFFELVTDFEIGVFHPEELAVLLNSEGVLIPEDEAEFIFEY
jgi:hypothetical protein